MAFVVVECMILFILFIYLKKNKYNVAVKEIMDNI